MAKIIINNNEYSLFDFDNEAEFEKAVIENKRYLFGSNSVYIDVKRRVGEKSSYHKGIPDAFLIDFYDKQHPSLYIVENELASHDVYANITEQIARFSASIHSSTPQIREKVIQAIHLSPETEKRIEKLLAKTVFSNIEELMLYLTEKTEIKIVVVINEITSDLNLSLSIFRNQPDIVLLQRYKCGDEVLYYYEPMREEIEDLEELGTDKAAESVDFDTVVCAAFEDGFKHAYVENNAWWAIRLSHDAREKLKYLAIYEKLPLAHIKHVAEIDRIEPYKDTGKFIVYLKNKKTIKPIPLGTGKKGEAPQSPRYTTIEKLLKAKSIHELWK